jgi:hypothetical protein
MFLSQFTPVNRCLRVLPLRRATSGAARPGVRQVADRAIAWVKQTNRSIVLNVASIDSDEAYRDDCRTVFGGILPFLDAAEFGQMFHPFICNQQTLWISDWPHLMTNSRTTLFRTKVFFDPQVLDSCTMVEQIVMAFEPSPTFTDESTLGKIRDSYPLDLFTLQSAYVLWE